MSLCLLGHNWGTINFCGGTMVWVPALGYLCPVHGRALPQRGSGASARIFFENLLSISKSAIWRHKPKKLAYVGVKYGTVKREKLVQHNRVKWWRLAWKNTRVYRRLTAGHRPRLATHWRRHCTARYKITFQQSNQQYLTPNIHNNVNLTVTDWEVLDHFELMSINEKQDTLIS